MEDTQRAIAIIKAIQEIIKNLKQNEEYKVLIDADWDDIERTFCEEIKSIHENRAQNILRSIGKELKGWVTSDGKVAVCYKNCEVKDGDFLISTNGIGNTFEKACQDYLERMQGKCLVFNAYAENREEILFTPYIQKASDAGGIKC